jgi:hypothetical protein
MSTILFVVNLSLPMLLPSRMPARQELPGPPAAGRPSVLAAFGGDEDDDKPARKLIPLEYTEEELKAMQQRQAAMSKPQDTQVCTPALYCFFR